MTPSWVLLHSVVEFCLKDEEENGEATTIPDDATAEQSKGTATAAVVPAPSLQSLMDSTVSFLRSLTPDALLHHPPKISTLRLRSSSRRLRDAAHGVPLSAVVACADKSMLVLYGGKYSGPGSSSRGCYLIYDAAVSGETTSTVPSLPLSAYLTSVVAGAVVLRRRSHSPPASSSYILAELATTAWRSDDDDSPTPTPQWEKKAVRLPPEVHADLDRHNFCVDTSLAFGDSGLCWVDLLRGIVVYHPDPHDDQFRFIPLPEDGCPEYTMSHYPYRPRMSEFRAAACVAGAIKLVALEGYLEGWNDSQQFRFVTWTLTPDDLGHQWKKDAVFYVAPDYAYLPGAEPARRVRGTEVVETKVGMKAQHVLGLDMKRNKVVSSECRRPARVDLITPRLFAVDFCACLQGPKDRQREEKASEVGGTGKRTKISSSEEQIASG
ncbi:hypothetical protein QOZ80_2BG0158030 [Eleusine coracana subsp. coracana]|nr:hypothetical protein QOZ80_2BG0158030 [Eleusine coracana subsp. coracana]